MKRNTWKWCWFIGVLMATSAWGQIDTPSEADPYKLIVSKLTTPIPDGAYVADGGWEIVGAAATVTADYREYPGELVWTGTPGVYQVLFDGVLLQDVTVPGMDGKPVTIRSYLGRIKAKGVTKIKGGSPPGPDPPDPPVPGGKYQIVLFYSENQLDNLPQGQRDILTSLVFRDWLRSQGHVLLEVLDPANFASGSVPDKWKPWVNAILNDPLPRICLSAKDEASYVADYPLPKDIEAVKALLANPAARKAVQR